MSIIKPDAVSPIKDLAPLQSAPQVSSTNSKPKILAEKAQDAQQPSPSDVQHAVHLLNKYVAPISPAIELSMDQDSGKLVVKVIDAETQTVLRQIPGAEALEISKSPDKLQGLLVRKSV